MKKNKHTNEFVAVFFSFAAFLLFSFPSWAYTGAPMPEENEYEIALEADFTLNTQQLELILLGDKAIDLVSADVPEGAEVNWSVLDASIASLDHVVGTYTIVTGLREGVTTLIATMTDGEDTLISECMVRVKSVSTLINEMTDSKYGCNTTVFDPMAFLLLSPFLFLFRR